MGLIGLLIIHSTELIILSKPFDTFKNDLIYLKDFIVLASRLRLDNGVVS